MDSLAPNNQPSVHAIMQNCNQAGQAAANSVPSPVPNAQDQIEGWGGAVIGLGVTIATAPEDGPLAPLVGRAVSGAVTGFVHTAIVRGVQKWFMNTVTTVGCINASTGGSAPLMVP